MAQFVRSKEKTEIVIICLLFLTTAEFILGATLLSTDTQSDEVISKQLTSENHNNQVWLFQEMERFILIPIPGIIAQLGSLAGATMQQQLDSAFSLPTELPKKKEINTKIKFRMDQSPLIKHPLNFRKTLQQINQQLNKALKTMNINSALMSTKMKEAIKYIDTVLKHYPNQTQEVDLFFDSISQPLKRLVESSEKFVVLSSQNSDELQKMANMTDAFAEAVYEIQSAKIEYINGTLKKEVDAKINRKNKLEKEIHSLKEELEQLKHSLEKSEKKFYQRLNRFLNLIRKHQKNPEVLTCLENVGINWNITDDFRVTCGIKSSRVERKNLRSIKIAKFIWKTYIEALKEMEDDIGQKEEDHQKLSLAVQMLEEKKNKLDQDILLLDNTTELVDELENQMEELIVDGWNNIVSLCNEIQSGISITITALLPENNTRRSMPSEEILQQTKEQLIKTRKVMVSVGRTLSVYQVEYETPVLDSLMTQLERMTKGDGNLVELEENLISACNEMSREIETNLMARMKPEE